MREDICTFANDLPGTGGPGIVMLGLMDKGVPSGTLVIDEMLRTRAGIRSDGNMVPAAAVSAEKRPCLRKQ